MATQLFLANEAADTHLGTNNAKLNGATAGWTSLLLKTSRGAGANTVTSANSVAGPTNGLEIQVTYPYEWISPPLSADITISGTITANLWASEFAMTDNIAVNFVVDVIRATDNSLVQICKSTRVTECAVGTTVAVNFTATPTSTVVNRGDRLRVRVFADDAGTMATGGYMNFTYAGTTAGVSGDSYITFTETFSFENPPGSFEQTVHDNQLTIGRETARTRQGQSFTAEGSKLTGVRPWLGKVGAPTDNLIIEVQSDSSGAPSGTVVGTVATVAGTSLSTTLQQIQYTVDIDVTENSTYWLVFRRSAANDTVNYYIAANGINASWSDPLGWNGTSWATTGDDPISVRWTFFGATTVLYLTDTVSDVSTSLDDREAWTSRGAGVTSVVTPTLSGWTTPIQLEPSDIAFAQTGFTWGTDTHLDGSADRTAQSFLAVAGKIASVTIRLGHIGTATDNVTVELQSDASGSPSGTVLATATLAASTITSVGNFVFTFSTPATVTAATYWIVCRRTGTTDASNYIRHGGDSTSTYANGLTKISTNSGTSYSNATSLLDLNMSIAYNAVDWFTKQLSAFTLTGMAQANLRALTSVASSCSMKCEIARVDSDGTNPTVWASWCLTGDNGGLVTATEAAYTAWVSGDDLAVMDGQRLRIRLYLDDGTSTLMQTGRTATLYYNGTTAAASGDSYVILPAVVTEYSAAVIEQEAFRFRNEDGSETTATWRQALNTADTINLEQVFRLRFAVVVTAATANVDFTLYYRRKPSGGSFGAWTEVDEAAPIYYVITSPNYVDLAPTTQQISSGTFDAGVMREGFAWTGSLSIPSGAHSESEFILKPIAAGGAVAGDTYEIRLEQTGTGVDLNTSTQVASFQIPAAVASRPVPPPTIHPPQSIQDRSRW